MKQKWLQERLKRRLPHLVGDAEMDRIRLEPRCEDRFSIARSVVKFFPWYQVLMVVTKFNDVWDGTKALYLSRMPQLARSQADSILCSCSPAFRSENMWCGVSQHLQFNLRTHVLASILHAYLTTATTSCFSVSYRRSAREESLRMQRHGLQCSSC